MPSPAQPAYDAVVIGSGPNGLAAAITLARAGRSVLVVEAASVAGGGMRSAELTLPGFVHDVCSGVHPMAVGSPFFQSLPLAEHGLEWVHPAAPLAHPLDDGSAAVLERSLALTGATLGPDARAYTRRMAPLVRVFDHVVADLLAPPQFPKFPLADLRFAFWAARSVRAVAESWFTGDAAKALLAGLAAHSFLPMEMA